MPPQQMKQFSRRYCTNMQVHTIIRTGLIILRKVSSVEAQEICQKVNYCKNKVAMDYFIDGYVDWQSVL